jgi:hypothetical protein
VSVYELQLKALEVVENGDVRKDEASNALAVSLIYPTTGKPVVTSVKELRLFDNQSIDFTGDDPKTEQPYTWSDRVLLKEEILGQTQVVVQLTDVEEVGKLDRFLAGVFKNLFKAAWGLATGGIGNVFLGAVTESISAAHLDSFDVPGTKVKVIGRAERFLAAGDLPNGNGSIDLDLALVVPKKVEIAAIVRNKVTKKPEHTRKTILGKGDRNGRVVLTLTRV